MTRQPKPPGPRGARTYAAILREAMELFHERGFAQTTVREIAERVGIEPPSLYNHFASKQAILAAATIGPTEELAALLREQIEARQDPRARLAAAVEVFVTYVGENPVEGSMSEVEWRALPPDDTNRFFAARDEIAGIFREIVHDGVDRGVFATDDVSLATISVLSICARVPLWFRTDGRLPLDEVAETLAGIALRAVGAEPPG